jgi:hypothetical protein
MRFVGDDYRDINRREGLFAEPRPTRDRHVVVVLGSGTLDVIGDANTPGIVFTTYFLAQPTLTFGGRLTGGSGAPFVMASVIAYYTNDNDMFYGADLQVRVESYDRFVNSEVFLTFEGTAMKIVPQVFQGQLP